MEGASISHETPDIRIERKVYDVSDLGTVHGRAAESFIVKITRCLHKLSKPFSCSWFMDGIYRVVMKRAPILQWLPKYSVKEDLLADITGGVTVAVMHVPLGNMICCYISIQNLS